MASQKRAGWLVGLAVVGVSLRLIHYVAQQGLPASLTLDEASSRPKPDPEPHGILSAGASRFHRLDCAREPEEDYVLAIEAENDVLRSVTRWESDGYLPATIDRPAPVTLRGLSVQVLQLSAKGRPLQCLDSNASMASAVSSSIRFPTAAQSVSHVDGAWVLSAQVQPVQYLFADDLVATVKPKGALLAFVGSEFAVTLADADDPVAVASAAQESARALLIAGLVGCLREQPLALVDGTWKVWVPPGNHPAAAAIELHRRAVRACVSNELQKGVARRVEEANWKEETGRVNPTPARRTFDAEAGSVVRVELSRLEGPQLVANADLVELRHTDGRISVVRWPVFLRVASTGLAPMAFGHEQIEGVWTVDSVQLQSLDATPTARLQALE